MIPRERVGRIQVFLESQGIEAYVHQYSLDGKPRGGRRLSVPVAATAVANLAATNREPAERFAEALWRVQDSSGRYRSRDGM